MRINGRRKMREGYDDARKEPIEWLALLSARSNFLTPTIGKSTAGAPITPNDIAHAIARSSDKLGAAVAMAMACQRANEWPVVHEHGYPRLCDLLRAQKAMPGVIAGARKFRARIVLRDAFDHIIIPTRRPSMRDAAEEAGIDSSAYRYIHKAATSMLQHAANTAAGDACRFLFSRWGVEADALMRTVDDAHDDKPLSVRETRSALNASYDAAALLEEILSGARVRGEGVLSLERR